MNKPIAFISCIFIVTFYFLMRISEAQTPANLNYILSWTHDGRDANGPEESVKFVIGRRLAADTEGVIFEAFTTEAFTVFSDPFTVEVIEFFLNEESTQNWHLFVKAVDTSGNPSNWSSHVELRWDPENPSVPVNLTLTLELTIP